jgi:SWI/SNF-related matrix-associated actin-dependent regulator of chromatin subfamily A protein 2/4
MDERKAIKEEYSGEAKFNVMITHYDLIMRDKAFLKKIKWNYLIVDEGHRLKNHESVLAKTLDNRYNSTQ